MRKIIAPSLALTLLAGSAAAVARADEVTDWNKIMLQAAHNAVPPTSPLVMSRVGAIVQASVFDAVNGIERRCSSIHVEPAAPPGASVRAAAVQAAYGALVNLYPLQKSFLDEALAASLDTIASDSAAEHSESIARGIEWGQAVADAIWAWRSTDGFAPPPPPFLGGNAVGEWRPTPPAFLPGAAPQFATMTPWVIDSPSQFRPAGPPALTSDEYAADFNETKSMGSLASAIRTPDQTLAALFWQASSPVYFFDTIAVNLGAQRHTTLSENARLLALLNVAIADAAIACWDAKYNYVFWRPVTAIALAAADGNPATDADPAWAPLFATPNFPEYPSGHCTVSGAAATVLSDFFGEETPFSVDSDVMVGVIRSFANSSAAVDEIEDARVNAGIHFRSACDDGRATGAAVANYILTNGLAPVHGIAEGQVQR